MRNQALWIFAVGALCGCASAASAADSAPELTGIVLTTDRTVDTTSDAAIVKSVIREGMTEQQKAYALWRFFIQRNMHREIPDQQDNGNTAELMTTSAYALCFNWGHYYASLAADAGMTASQVSLNGHVISAVKYWDGWHAYDPDMWALYTHANGIVASPADIGNLKDADGKFMLKHTPPVKSYPWYQGPDTVAGLATLYEKSEVHPVYAPHDWKWNYDLHLRPGMEISWSWYGDPDVGFVSLTHLPDVRSAKPFKTLREYIESTFDYYQQKEGKPKFSWGNRRGGLVPNPLGSWNGVDGNGRLTFELGRDGCKNALSMMSNSENISVTDGKLALTSAGKDGSFVLNFSIPYPYGDAWIAKPLPAGLRAEISLDGKEYKSVYPEGGMDDGQRIRLFDFVRGKSAFFLKVTLPAQSAPLDCFTAVGAFHHAYTALPALLKGRNKISIRLKNLEQLATAPLHATYIYDQVGFNRETVLHKNDYRVILKSQAIFRHEGSVSFTPDSLTQTIDAGEHWPLMREIRLRCGGEQPIDPAPTVETGDTGELDWGAAPWDWVYHGVNFWNDFERGDRQGWMGKLVTNVNGSDLALDNSLLNADGGRQLKLIRFGAFLNRDSKFRCQLFVRNIKNLRIYTRNQGDNGYYEKTFESLKEGEWQPFEATMNDLVEPKSGAKIKNNDFLSNIYLQVTPADGKAEKDVAFMIDDTICFDGELKHDPFTNPHAAENALKDDPIWNAHP